MANKVNAAGSLYNFTCYGMSNFNFYKKRGFECRDMCIVASNKLQTHSHHNTVKKNLYN